MSREPSKLVAGVIFLSPLILFSAHAWGEKLSAKLPRGWEIRHRVKLGRISELKESQCGWSSPTEARDGRVLINNGHLYTAWRPSGVSKVYQQKPATISAAAYVSPLELESGHIITASGAQTFVFDPKDNVGIKQDFLKLNADKISHRNDSSVPVYREVFHSSPVPFNQGWVIVDSGKIDPAQKPTIYKDGSPFVAIPAKVGVISTPLVMEDGSLFIATSTGVFYVLDAQTGRLTEKSNLEKLNTQKLPKGRWPSLIFSSPTRMADGRIAIGSHTQYQNGGRVFLFDEKGAPLGKSFDAEGHVIASPLGLRSGGLVVSTTNGYVHFLDKHMNPVKSHRRLSLEWSSPIQLADGSVMIAGDRGTFYLFSESGDLVGEFWFPGGNSGTSTPAQLKDGTIVFCAGGELIVLATGMKSKMPGRSSFMDARTNPAGRSTKDGGEGQGGGSGATVPSRGGE